MTFHEAIRQLAADDQRDVLEKMAYLRSRPVAGHPNRMAALLDATESDPRISEHLWDSFFAVVLSAIYSALEDSIRAWARANSVKGVRATFTPPLTTVQSRARLLAWISGQGSKNGDLVGPKTAISIVGDLVSPNRWRTGCQRASDLGLTMTEYTAWATFANPAVPYAGLPGRATTIGCELGLDDLSLSGINYRAPLVVLEYMPARIEPKIPTMIEAWCSDVPNYYFRPGHRLLEHGQTQPWPNAPIDTLSRPEVVHEPAQLANLTRKAKLITR